MTEETTILTNLMRRVRVLEEHKAEQEGALKLGRWAVGILIAVGGLTLAAIRLWP